MFAKKNKNTFFALVVIAMALNACASEKQEFEKGFKDKYEKCVESYQQLFKEYKGFRFDYDKAICVCNGIPCQPNQICNEFGMCSDITAISKCEDGSFKCVSASEEQKCVSGEWGPVIECPENTPLCNPYIDGKNDHCSSSCMNKSTVCFDDNNGIGYFQTCNETGTDYTERQECDNGYSCADNKCGECSNDDLKCEENGKVKKCQIGSWGDYSEFKNQCFVPEDEQKTVSAIICNNEKIVSGTCNDGSVCKDDGTCSNGLSETDICELGSVKCDGNIVKKCKNGWHVINCENNNLYTCTNNELSSETCEYGCAEDGSRCNKEPQESVCNLGELQCNGDELQICENNSWQEQEKCSNGCDENEKKCIESPSDCNSNECKDNEDYIGQLVECISSQPQPAKECTKPNDSTQKVSCKSVTECGECLNGNYKYQDANHTLNFCQKGSSNVCSFILKGGAIWCDQDNDQDDTNKIEISEFSCEVNAETNETELSFTGKMTTDSSCSSDTGGNCSDMSIVLDKDKCVTIKYLDGSNAESKTTIKNLKLANKNDTICVNIGDTGYQLDLKKDSETLVAYVKKCTGKCLGPFETCPSDGDAKCKKGEMKCPQAGTIIKCDGKGEWNSNEEQSYPVDTDGYKCTVNPNPPSFLCSKEYTDEKTLAEACGVCINGTYNCKTDSVQQCTTGSWSDLQDCAPNCTPNNNPIFYESEETARYNLCKKADSTENYCQSYFCGVKTYDNRILKCYLDTNKTEEVTDDIMSPDDRDKIGCVPKSTGGYYCYNNFLNEQSVDNCCANNNYYCFERKGYYCNNGHLEPYTVCDNYCKMKQTDASKYNDGKPIEHDKCVENQNACDISKDKYKCSDDFTKVLQCRNNEWNNYEEDDPILVISYFEDKDENNKPIIKFSSCSSNLENSINATISNSSAIENLYDFMAGTRPDFTTTTLTSDFFNSFKNGDICADEIYNFNDLNQSQTSVLINQKIKTKEYTTIEFKKCSQACNEDHTACNK